MKVIVKSLLVKTLLLIFAGILHADGGDNPLLEATRKFDALSRYGYDFFKSETVDKAVATPEMPVTDEYQIKPGDELMIEMRGSVNQKYALTVGRDGSIEIPNIGRLYLAGDNFGQVREKIRHQLINAHKLVLSSDSANATSINVNMGKLAGSRVIVTGYVGKKGIIFLDGADSSILRALGEAGGILPSGSLRQIEVKRDGESSLKFDLYDFLINGHFDPKFKFLKDNDIVFVGKKGKEIFLDGAVTRPGVYELLPGETFKELLNYAGGLKQIADLERIQVLRIEKGQSLSLRDISVRNGGGDITLEDQDKISILEKKNERIADIVIVKGDGVRYPGIYQFEKDMTLESLIGRCGGLTPDARKDSSLLMRMGQDMKRDISQINLDESMKMPLRPMDQLHVFSGRELSDRPDEVELHGHVLRPGKYELFKGMTVGNLLKMGGGFENALFLKHTFLQRADIIRINPDTHEKEVIVFNLGEVLKGGSGPQLLPGDSVRIYDQNTMRTKSYAEIYGEVKNPGRVELKVGMTLEDIIFEAGGFSDGANRDKIEIARSLPDKKIIEIVYFNDPTLKGYKLMDQDKIVIRSRSEINSSLGKVKIIGEIANPGSYLLQSQERLDSIIKRIGGFTENAFLNGTVMIRNNRRVVIDLKEALASPDSEKNIILMNDDMLYIPPLDTTVKVTGEVYVAQKIFHQRGKDAGFYVEQCGGLKNNADKGNIKIIYPNGVVTDAVSGFFSRTAVEPGCIVIVPPKDELKLAALLEDYSNKLLVDKVKTIDKQEQTRLKSISVPVINDKRKDTDTK